MMGTLGTLVLTSVLIAAPARGTGEPIPGGYWGVGERSDPPPPDGAEWIYVGSALVPLGTLGTAAAIGSMVYGHPGRCSLEPDACQRMFVSGAAGVGSAGLMLITGATVLSVGLVQRARHRAWRKRHNLAARWPSSGWGAIGIAPWSVRTSPRGRSAGVTLHMRF